MYYQPDPEKRQSTMNLSNRFLEVRSHSEALCAPLQTEDYVAQPVVDVSPPKWHLAHTTWFFEAFIIQKFVKRYQPFREDYDFIFNSYYIGMGDRVMRPERGHLTRPGVEEVYQYRKHVNDIMVDLINHHGTQKDFLDLLELGLQHEQQHQELLLSDIKYILGHNPLFPVYSDQFDEASKTNIENLYLNIGAGVYEVGYDGPDFCFDNEKQKHRVFLEDFKIRKGLVSNAEYLSFIQDGGYREHRFWHSEGWDWVRTHDIGSPLYWHHRNGEWWRYSLSGLQPVDPNAPVTHVSYYEAYAYAEWSGKRLPTEFEWEVASGSIPWGDRWEWTGSAYLPYPGFKRFDGNAGEYNGKFMINQMVLRGASIATPSGHSRMTYRNFFHAPLRWQFTGIRLAQ
jgi:ergothioneine biosynthesis protein EgtB